MTWRLARSLQVLRGELDALAPGRDRSSDGTIGDARHQAAGARSDHNPNAAGVVRALDVDAGPGLYPAPPLDALAVQLAEHVRQLGLAGFPPLMNGGYVIWSGRIASARHGWSWRPYTGVSQHRDHVHVSVSLDAARYDDQSSWNVTDRPGTSTPPPSSPAAPAPPAPAPTPPALTVASPEAVPVHTVNLSNPAQLVTGPGVRALQALLALTGLYRGSVDGKAGPMTRGALVAYQRAAFGKADGIAGPATFGALDSL